MERGQSGMPYRESEGQHLGEQLLPLRVQAVSDAMHPADLTM